MKSLFPVFAVLLSIFLCLQSHAQAILKPGDPVKIDLKVPAEDAANVSALYTVSEKGLLRMPYLEKEIKAASLSVTELSRQIETAYKTEGIYTNPTVIATLAGVEVAQPHVVTVGGEVRKPGEVPLREGMRLFMAISTAGGFTEFADVKHVKIIRGGKEKVYDLRRVGGGEEGNPVLADGDQIVVPMD